jgi:hypothetical protein
MGLLVLASLGVARAAPGQTGATKPDAVLVALNVRVSQFLEGVSADDAQKALNELLSGSPLKKQDDAIKKLVEETKALRTKYGRYLAFEKISAKRVGADLVLLKYLYKCENFPVVWHFTFYRPPAPGEAAAETGTWRVVIVRIDTNLELLERE